MESPHWVRKTSPAIARTISALALLWAAWAPAALADAEADAFIRSMEDLIRSETNITTYRMTVIRPDGNREFVMQSWDDRVTDRSFIHILAPVRDTDTTLLKVEGNLWMYLPRLERDIRIPPAMMLNSWMGSDFTNDDLVNESSALTDYENTILGREPGPDGTEFVTIESIPHEDAPVVWGKVVLRIRNDGVPVSQDFYDEDGALVRAMSFENVETVDGRTIPTRWVMESLIDPGHSTVLDLEDMAFDVQIPDDVFTRANLSRRR